MESIRERIFEKELPEKTATYTPVPHRFVAEKVESKLDNINQIKYLATSEYDLVVITYILEQDEEGVSDVIIMENSYDKSRRFSIKTGISFEGNIFLNDNDLQNFRMHTGEANAIIEEMIDDAIKSIKLNKQRIKSTIERLSKISITTKNISWVMGELFLEYNILRSGHINLFKNTLKRHIRESDREQTKFTYYDLLKMVSYTLRITSAREWSKTLTSVYKYFEFIDKETFKSTREEFYKLQESDDAPTTEYGYETEDELRESINVQEQEEEEQAEEEQVKEEQVEEKVEEEKVEEEKVEEESSIEEQEETVSSIENVQGDDDIDLLSTKYLNKEEEEDPDKSTINEEEETSKHETIEDFTISDDAVDESYDIEDDIENIVDQEDTEIDTNNEVTTSDVIEEPGEVNNVNSSLCNEEENTDEREQIKKKVLREIDDESVSEDDIEIEQSDDDTYYVFLKGMFHCVVKL